MAFNDNAWLPGRYAVYAELTGGPDLGYRYQVRQGRLDTLAKAKAAIKADIKAVADTGTFGGLIDWGKAAPREYAIFDLSPKRVD